MRAVAAREPVLVGPGATVSCDHRVNRARDALPVVDMNAPEPPVGVLRGALVVVAEPCLEPAAPPNEIGLEVPVPFDVVARDHEQPSALLVQCIARGSRCRLICTVRAYGCRH